MSQKLKSSHSGGSKGDVSCIRATVTPVPMSPSPAFRDGNHTPVQQMANMDADWDGRDELLQRELEEARARTSQMEKTMRWWSDCTANWREKWSKVRNERNKAREENRQLRAKLEQLVKECTETKRKNQELTVENAKLKEHSEVDRRDFSQVSSSIAEGNINAANSPRQSQNSTTSANNTYDLVSYDTNLISSDKELDGKDELEDNLAEEKAALYELKLDEAQKTLMAERGDKTTLAKSIEKLQLELASVKSKYEDMKRSKQDVILEITKVKDDHKEDIVRLKKDLEEEMCNKSNVDKKLGEVRRELEKLQRENADEWGKRERLETDKFALERENKKLRCQIEDLEDQLDRKKQQTSALLDSDVRTMQLELSEKTKELNDLRHSHAKVKKSLQDKITDLEHTRRRADQYEMEVKKLRARVDELKKELANTEDEVDTQSNMVRKVQRTNDELQEMVENLQVQLNHTESRLKRSSQSALNTLVTGRNKGFDLCDPDDDSDDFDED